ncbi:MAG: hypothetical protein ACP5R5_08705 [Armatimonadota bacterium]
MILREVIAIARKLGAFADSYPAGIPELDYSASVRYAQSPAQNSLSLDGRGWG